MDHRHWRGQGDRPDGAGLVGTDGDAVVDGLVGTVAMRTHLAPRMGYGKEGPTLRTASGQLVATVGCEDLWLDSDVDLTTEAGCWTGAFTVTAGQRVTFTLGYTAGEPRRPDPDADGALAATIAFWTDWRSRSTYTGPWAAEVNQSLIILKALTYAPAGSILAAATTSLPEWLGGSRN